MITYAAQERVKYWPVSNELMAQYKDGSHTDKDNFGTLAWFKKGKLHRDGDKPAVIGADGQVGWYQNGLWHRDDDKPAVIGPGGSLGWWQNNKLHRICGPAVIYSDGRFDWWINSKNITQEVNAWLAGEEWQGTPEQIFEFQLRFS